MSTSNDRRVAGVVRWSAVAVAAASAVVHAAALAGGPPPSSLPVVVLLVAASGCLPCAAHLALLPRRRAWAQMAVVSAAMLATHPLLSLAGGAGHHTRAGHGGSRALDLALVLGPVLGLVLAVAGLLLGERRRLPAA